MVTRQLLLNEDSERLSFTGNDNLKIVHSLFWEMLLGRLSKVSIAYHDSKPNHNNCLFASSGFAGIRYQLYITQKYASVGIIINTASKNKNKFLYKKLEEKKEALELDFGDELFWKPMPDNNMSALVSERYGLNIKSPSDWFDIISFMTSKMPLLEKAIRNNFQQNEFDDNDV